MNQTMDGMVYYYPKTVANYLSLRNTMNMYKYSREKQLKNLDIDC